MIVVMEAGTTPGQIKAVDEKLKKLGFETHPIIGVERTVIGVIGSKELLAQAVEIMPGVEKIMPVLKPYKLASREFKAENSVVKVKNVEIGGEKLVVMAGPCAVESREQLLDVARTVKAAGANILRGGAFKPRTSPYAFQGLEEEGLKYLAEASAETGMPVVTEVVDPRSVEVVAKYADILQIGARNMQNFFLLKEVGKTKKPVLLKRGLTATYEEFLMAAEYVMSEGNYDIILCERGVRSFETYTRNTLDITAIPVIKQLSHLPIIIDPSHSTGRWKLVAPVCRGAVATGADGLIVEVHPNPEEALCDGAQSLTPKNFANMLKDLKPFAEAAGRTIDCID